MRYQVKSVDVRSVDNERDREESRLLVSFALARIEPRGGRYRDERGLLFTALLNTRHSDVIWFSLGGISLALIASAALYARAQRDVVASARRGLETILMIVS